MKDCFQDQEGAFQVFGDTFDLNNAPSTFMCTIN